MVPVQRPLQHRRTTEYSLLRPPPPIHPSCFLATKSDRAAAPLRLWTGVVMFPFFLEYIGDGAGEVLKLVWIESHWDRRGDRAV